MAIFDEIAKKILEHKREEGRKSHFVSLGMEEVKEIQTNLYDSGCTCMVHEGKLIEISGIEVSYSSRENYLECI